MGVGVSICVAWAIWAIKMRRKTSKNWDKLAKISINSEKFSFFGENS